VDCQKDALEDQKKEQGPVKGQKLCPGYETGIDEKRNAGKKGPAKDNENRAAGEKFPKQPCKSKQENGNVNFYHSVFEYGEKQVQKLTVSIVCI